jgi:hypothetical protein
MREKGRVQACLKCGIPFFAKVKRGKDGREYVETFCQKCRNRLHNETQVKKHEDNERIRLVPGKPDLQREVEKLIMIERQESRTHRSRKQPLNKI